jgi:2-methylcitrate dehydratase PrpD
MSPPGPAPASPAAALATWAASLRYEDLPPDVVDHARRSLLGFVALVVGAQDEDAVRQAIAAVQALGGAPQSSILGANLRTSCHHAALVNGIAAGAIIDDARLAAAIQPAGPAMAAALAVGEWRSTSGRDVITAFAAGCEVQRRVGLAVQAEQAGAGAAVAAGRLLGLTSQQMAWALGMAAGRANGGPERLGGPARPLRTGQAAADGVMAAVLAHHDFDPSGRSFDGRGSAGVPATASQLEPLTDALSQHWELLDGDTGPDAAGGLLSDADLRAQAHELLWAYLPRAVEDRLIALVDTLESLEDISAIAELLEPIEHGDHQTAS